MVWVIVISSMGSPSLNSAWVALLNLIATYGIMWAGSVTLAYEPPGPNAAFKRSTDGGASCWTTWATLKISLMGRTEPLPTLLGVQPGDVRCVLVY